MLETILLSQAMGENELLFPLGLCAVYILFIVSEFISKIQCSALQRSSMTVSGLIELFGQLATNYR